MSKPTIDLICFPGAPNLPIFAALKKGWFDEAGVSVNMNTTPNSAFQAENLAAGKFQIAGTGFVASARTTMQVTAAGSSFVLRTPTASAQRTRR